MGFTSPAVSDGPPVPMPSEAGFPRARGSETSQGSGDPPSSQQKLLLFSTTD